MIGYEFEFLVREGDAPLFKKTFEKFHQELALRGWKNKFDSGTQGLTGSDKDGWVITTDDGICIMEINTPPRNTIKECDEQINSLLKEIQSIYKSLGASIIGVGTFPGEFDIYKTTCDKNICLEPQCCDKSYIRHFNPQRFPKGHHALMTFAGNHVWLDTTPEQLIALRNVLCRLSGIINALFANGSIFNNTILETLDGRDMLWKTMLSSSIHGDETKYYGMPPTLFPTLVDYFKFQLEFPFYFDVRDGKGYRLKNPATTYNEFFHAPKSEAVLFDGTSFIAIPEKSDFFGLQQKLFPHSRIKYRIRENVKIADIINAIDNDDEEKLLSCFSKVFIEYRNIGAQPQSDISAGPAFLLGIQENLGEVKKILDRKPYDFWIQLYDQVLKSGITDKCLKFLELAKQGLQTRGYGEEQYLQPLYTRLEQKNNPAQELIKIWEQGGLEAVWKERDFKKIMAPRQLV
jgi:gamma-glutamylcysteine synthetase